MPMDRKKYPPDWEAISRRIRFERAGNKCEWCGVINGAVGARDLKGSWHDEDSIHGMNSTDGYYTFGPSFNWKMTKIVLTVAHLDHNTENNRDDNLAALCQRCHNRYDSPMRVKHAAQTRQRNKLKRTGQQELGL